MSEQLLTVDELAAYLKVPKSWVYSRTRARGPDTIPLMVCGKYRRFKLSEVMDWLKEQNKEAE